METMTQLTADVLALSARLASGNLEAVGTVAQFVGLNGKIIFNDANIQDADKSVMVDILRADGWRGRLFCSRNVGETIRKKELTVPELLGLRVVKDKTKSGNDTLRIVGWESSGSSILVKSLDTTRAATAQIKEVADLSDLGGI